MPSISQPYKNCSTATKFRHTYLSVFVLVFPTDIGVPKLVIALVKNTAIKVKLQSIFNCLANTCQYHKYPQKNQRFHFFFLFSILSFIFATGIMIAQKIIAPKNGINTPKPSTPQRMYHNGLKSKHPTMMQPITISTKLTIIIHHILSSINFLILSIFLLS